jgi:Carboxypeptidase regulatory-like domain
MPISTAVLIMSLFAQTPGSNGRLAGRVVDAASQKPIAGARVTAMQIAETQLGTYGGPPIETLTDDEGRFAFEGLPTAVFQLEAKKNGFASWPEPMAGRTFHVTNGQTMSVDIALKKGAVLTGRVIDSRGEPLAEMMIMVLRTGGDQPDAFPFMQGNNHTNDLGEFRVANLAEGPYVLMAVPQPREPFAQQARSTTAMAPTYYPSTTDRQAAQKVEARAGETAEGLQITMVVAEAFQISGTVVDAAGKPAGGAMVSLMSERMLIPFMPSMVTAQPDGTFRITGVLPGDYRLMATASTGDFFGGGSFEVASLGGGIGAVSSGFSLSGADDSIQAPGVRVTVGDADVGGLRIVAREGR